MISSCGGISKTEFSFLHFRLSLKELKQRITIAVASVEGDMFRSVWTELDYRIGVCRVTKGSHIEHL